MRVECIIFCHSFVQFFDRNGYFGKRSKWKSITKTTHAPDFLTETWYAFRGRSIFLLSTYKILLLLYNFFPSYIRSVDRFGVSHVLNRFSAIPIILHTNRYPDLSFAALQCGFGIVLLFFDHLIQDDVLYFFRTAYCVLHCFSPNVY